MNGLALAVDAQRPGRRFDWPRWRWFWREVADCADRQETWRLYAPDRAAGCTIAGASAFVTHIFPPEIDRGRGCCASCTAYLLEYPTRYFDPDEDRWVECCQYVCPLGCEYPMPPGHSLKAA